MACLIADGVSFVFGIFAMIGIIFSMFTDEGFVTLLISFLLYLVIYMAVFMRFLVFWHAF